MSFSGTQELKEAEYPNHFTKNSTPFLRLYCWRIHSIQNTSSFL